MMISGDYAKNLLILSCFDVVSKMNVQQGKIASKYGTFSIIALDLQRFAEKILLC